MRIHRGHVVIAHLLAARGIFAEDSASRHLAGRRRKIDIIDQLVSKDDIRARSSS